MKSETAQYFIENWVPALRNGDYSQAHGRLRQSNTNTMCCLGVLCDVVNPEGWIYADSYITLGEYQYKETSETAVLPPALNNEYEFKFGGCLPLVPTSKFIGFTYEDKQIFLNNENTPFALEPGENYFCLAAYNDGGASFEKIADAVETIANEWLMYNEGVINES